MASVRNDLHGTTKRIASDESLQTKVNGLLFDVLPSDSTLQDMREISHKIVDIIRSSARAIPDKKDGKNTSN